MKRLKIVVCSANRVKVNSVKTACYTLEIDASFASFESQSGVSDQPMSYSEAYRGACNRIEYIRKMDHTFDLYIAIESGITYCEATGRYFDFAYTVLENTDGSKRYISKSIEFEIEKEIMDLIHQGNNLSQASTLMYKLENVGNTIGISGIKSFNKIPRHILHSQPTIFALSDFLRNSTL